VTLRRPTTSNRHSNLHRSLIVSLLKPAHGVCTDPGKVWKVLEFNVEIFKAMKSLENDHRYGKVWKNP